MNITHADGAFWQAVKAPAWLAGSKRPDKVSSLHYAINGHAKTAYPHAGRKPADSDYEKHNAMVCLKLARKHEEPYLYMIEASIAYKRVQPKRAATYRRWLRAIERRRTIVVHSTP